MKITILNGDMNQGESSFSRYIQQLSDAFRVNHSITTFTLSAMNLSYCTGCWNCWWKTPGRCVIGDDAEKIFRSVINSDLFLFASPLIAGFTTSCLKKITDRFVVFVHPYIQLINGECHHKKRYPKFPDFGLLLEKETNTDAEDLEIVTDIYDRLALNMHSRKKFIKCIETSKIEDILHEATHS